MSYFEGLPDLLTGMEACLKQMKTAASRPTTPSPSSAASASAASATESTFGQKYIGQKKTEEKKQLVISCKVSVEELEELKSEDVSKYYKYDMAILF